MDRALSLETLSLEKTLQNTVFQESPYKYVNLCQADGNKTLQNAVFS